MERGQHLPIFLTIDVRLVWYLREKTGPDRSVTCHAGSLSPMSVPQAKSQEVWAPHPHDMEPQASGRYLQIRVLCHHIPCSLDMKGGIFNYHAFLNCRCINIIQGRAWPTSYPSKHSGQHSPLHETKGLSSSPNQPYSGESQEGEKSSLSWESWASTIEGSFHGQERNPRWGGTATSSLSSASVLRFRLPPVCCCDQCDLFKPGGRKLRQLLRGGCMSTKLEGKATWVISQVTLDK